MESAPIWLQLINIKSMAYQQSPLRSPPLSPQDMGREDCRNPAINSSPNSNAVYPIWNVSIHSLGDLSLNILSIIATATIVQYKARYSYLILESRETKTIHMALVASRSPHLGNLGRRNDDRS